MEMMYSGARTALQPIDFYILFAYLKCSDAMFGNTLVNLLEGSPNTSFY